MKVDVLVRSKGVPLAPCIDAFRAATPPEQYRLIVLDQGPEFYTGSADLVVHWTDPPGPIVAANHGLALALQDSMASYVLLLDGDVILPQEDRGWLLRMIGELEQAGPACAAVAATSNQAEMPQSILTAPQVYEQDWQEGTRHGVGSNPPVPWFFSFAVLLRKSAVAQCGLMDTQFGEGPYGDFDYALLLRTHEYTIRVARSVYVQRPEIQEAIQHGAEYRKWIDKWGAGRLYDLKVLPASHLQAALQVGSRG